MIKFCKGEKVIVRDCDNNAKINRIWEVSNERIYVCSDHQYQLLKEGVSSIIAIGFPKEDVFSFAKNHISDIANLSIVNWADLISFAN